MCVYIWNVFITPFFHWTDAHTRARTHTSCCATCQAAAAPRGPVSEMAWLQAPEPQVLGSLVFRASAGRELLSDAQGRRAARCCSIQVGWLLAGGEFWRTYLASSYFFVWTKSGFARHAQHLVGRFWSWLGFLVKSSQVDTCSGYLFSFLMCSFKHVFLALIPARNDCRYSRAGVCRKFIPTLLFFEYIGYSLATASNCLPRWRMSSQALRAPASAQYCHSGEIGDNGFHCGSLSCAWSLWGILRTALLTNHWRKQAIAWNFPDRNRRDRKQWNDPTWSYHSPHGQVFHATCRQRMHGCA